jgi:hypothetical protein
MASEAYITKYFYSEKTLSTEALCLSMQIASGSFMYAISTHNFKNVVELCHVEIPHTSNSTFDLTERLSFLVHNYQLHQKKFEKVNIAFLNNEFALLPEAFASADVKPLLKFSTGVQEIKRSLKHHINDLDFCFTLDQELIHYFEKTFPNASLRHLGAVSIALFFSQHSLSNNDLFLSIGDNFIELASKEKNEMLFYNVFSYENNEDILYYLLFTMEQFNLNPLHVKLAIAAQRGQSDDLLKSIKKYIKQVSFSVTEPSVVLNGDLSNLPQHYYFTLLNQHVCEL